MVSLLFHANLQYVNHLYIVVPAMTRSDAGTENGIVATCQTYLRRNFFDNLAGEKSHVYGTSMLNQVVSRVESLDIQTRFLFLQHQWKHLQNLY